MKVFLRTMRTTSTRYRLGVWFSFGTFVQSREVRFSADRSSGMYISEYCQVKAGAQHRKYPRILHLRRFADCPSTEAAIGEAATTAVVHEAPKGASPTDKSGGYSMKNQSRHSSYETIVKIFRDLGLDDPELCRRLQDFSKPEILPRQIERRGDVIITRSNTVSNEGEDNA